MFAPIVLFTYSRLKNTKETIECLLGNKESSQTELIVFSDAPKNEKAEEKVIEVRNYIHCISGFKSVRIIEREENFGLAKNIVTGVTEVLNEFESAIILEDDFSVSPYFLQYMNEGLEKYKDNDDIVSIHGYTYPHKNTLPEAFLIKGADCWSWATWRRAWSLYNGDAAYLYQEIVKKKLQREFEFNFSYPYMNMLRNQAKGVANSWAICWYASTFLLNKYTLYPGISMSRINSLEDAGTHSNPSQGMLKYNVEVKVTPIDWSKVVDDRESLLGRKTFESFFRTLKSWKRRLYESVINLFR